jgi:thiol:disulfide interchange protein DsbD
MLVVALAGHVIAEDRIQSTVSMHVGAQGFRPGATIPIALLIELPEDWYTYAAEPGDAGMPPDIRMQAPEGVTMGEWRFPPHEVYTDEAGTYNIFKKRVVLLNEIHIPRDVPENVAFTGKFNVIWMICKDVCLPFRDTITVTLPQLSANEIISVPDGWKPLLESGGWKQNKPSGGKPHK